MQSETPNLSALHVPSYKTSPQTTNHQAATAAHCRISPYPVLLSAVSVTCRQPQSKNYETKNSRNKQFTSFKLHAVLSSTMKSRAIPLHPPGTGISPLSSISTLCTLPAVSHSVASGYQTDFHGMAVRAF